MNKPSIYYLNHTDSHCDIDISTSFNTLQLFMACISRRVRSIRAWFIVSSWKYIVVMLRCVSLMVLVSPLRTIKTNFYRRNLVTTIVITEDLCTHVSMMIEVNGWFGRPFDDTICSPVGFNLLFIYEIISHHFVDTNDEALVQVIFIASPKFCQCHL